MVKSSFTHETPEQMQARFASHTPKTSFSRADGLPRPSDAQPKLNDTERMTDITRPELDAKLEAVEARMDARVSAIGGKIDAFLAAQVERDKTTSLHFGHIERDISELKTSVGSMKTTIIVTAVSTVLAIVIGIAGFNAMLTSNMITSFQLGKSETSTQASPQSAAPALQPQQTQPEVKK